MTVVVGEAVTRVGVEMVQEGQPLFAGDTTTRHLTSVGGRLGSGREGSNV